jgi:ribonuclease HI
MAALTITGGLRSTATDILDLHANLLPVELLMHKICFSATTRLTTVPDTHPLFPMVTRCSRRYVKRHKSALHNLFHIYKIQPQLVETINPIRQRPSYVKNFQTHIASTSEAAIKEDAELENNTDIRIYSDGSGYKGKAGAAATLYRGNNRPRTLQYCLGKLTEHTVYEAEAMGVTLGLHLLRKEVAPKQSSISIDNQAVINATDIKQARPSHYLIDKIHQLAILCARNFSEDPEYALTLRWVPGHSDVAANEAILVDGEAKKAAEGSTSRISRLPKYLRDVPLPISTAAMKQRHTKQLQDGWKARWKESPRFTKISAIDPCYDAFYFFNLHTFITNHY